MLEERIKNQEIIGKLKFNQVMERRASRITKEKFDDMLKKERRIPFHQFSFGPKFVVADSNHPFSTFS